MKTAIDFLKEVRAEMRKVTWPKRDEVINLTLTVIIISIIVGAYLGALDYAFTKLLEKLILS